MATKYYDASAAWLLPAFMRRDALDFALAGRHLVRPHGKRGEQA